MEFQEPTQLVFFGAVMSSKYSRVVAAGVLKSYSPTITVVLNWATGLVAPYSFLLDAGDPLRTLIHRRRASSRSASEADGSS